MKILINKRINLSKNKGGIMRNIFKISREFSENLSKIFVTSTESNATSTESVATSTGSARSQGYGCSEVRSVNDHTSTEPDNTLIYLKTKEEL